MLLILKFDLMLSMQLTRLYQNLLPQEGVSAALPWALRTSNTSWPAIGLSLCSIKCAYPTLYHGYHNANNELCINFSLDADIAALAHSQEEQPVMTAVINRSSSLNDIEAYRSSDLSASAFLLSFVRSGAGAEEHSQAMDLSELNTMSIGCLSRLDSIDMNMNIGTFSHAIAGKHYALLSESHICYQMEFIISRMRFHVTREFGDQLTAVEVVCRNIFLNTAMHITWFIIGMLVFWMHFLDIP